MGDCPTADELFAFAVGRMPAEAREATATHIEECDACLATLHQLEDQDDTLVCELRKPVPAELFTEDHVGAMGAAAPPALPGYEVLGLLGKGGMGVVWRSHDRRLRRDVAVKVMKTELAGRPRLSHRFLEEAQVASQLAHPAIPPVHELGELPDGRPYFAMKLVKGRTFAELLEARSSPAEDLPRLLWIFEQVCQAVAYAHSKGVIHRDLKPQNVMVGAFGEVQVMDWGLAKVLAAQPAAVAVTNQPDSIVATVRTARADGATQEGSVLGTYAYMAPEQARGEVERLDRRCDVFGLGAMLCEILTAQPPYVGTAAEVQARAEVGHLATARERLAACGADPELVGLAGRCLSAQPEGRPTDAGEVAGAVAAYLAGVQERLRRAELERAAAEGRAAEERKRRRVLLALAAAVLALVGVGAAGGLLVQHYAAGRQAEQARREGEQRQAVEFALDKAAGLRQHARYSAAAAVLEQARGVLRDAGLDDLRQRLAVAEAELGLVKRLDAIRQDRGVDLLTPFAKQAPRGNAAMVRKVMVMGTRERQPSQTSKDYAAAFSKAGLGEVGDDVAAVAARVQTSGISGPLVAALDDWAFEARGSQSESWLLGVARLTDPDLWRNRFRDPAVLRDHRTLQALAGEALRDGEAKLDALSPQLLTSVSRRLFGLGEGLPLLRAAQRRHPNDFWLNFELSHALRNMNREEAAGYARVAVALRPDSGAAHYNLGVMLWFTDLHGEKDADGAIKEFQQATKLDPQLAVAHTALGIALLAREDIDGAVVALRRAITCDPSDWVVTKAAHYNLGKALLRQGRFADSGAVTRARLKLLDEHDAWRADFSQQLRESERLSGLDEKLPSVLRGDAEPAGPSELLEFAQFCRRYKRLHAAAARFYADAFIVDPKLTADLRLQHGYNAACSAALAAAGQAEDAKHLPEKAAGMLRRQALGWLRDDLDLYAKLAEREDPAARQMVRERMQQWQQNTDLASVCDTAALDRLADDERASWRRLWADVAALRKKVEKPQ
jgi:serine/threonine-protein kinase